MSAPCRVNHHTKVREIISGQECSVCEVFIACMINVSTSLKRLLSLMLFIPSTLFAVTGDADNDGLRDEVETNTGVFASATNTGTNPNLADSDGDSLPDGMEINLGTHPLDAVSKVKRPNIIFIIVDDLGYGDVGCFWQNQRTGTQKFATPGLDSMATEGAMLSHHYTAAPVCAPARGSLFQGRHQGKLGYSRQPVRQAPAK